MRRNEVRSGVRVGIIGAGERIRAVMRELLAAAAAEGGEIRFTAVFDPDPVSVAKTCEEFAIPTACESYAGLVALADVDWVMIGSWNSQHAEHAIAALDAGKDVFCEKPLATSLEDCLAVRDAVQRSGRTFAFGLVLRYSPHYQRVREIIASGELGQIVSFEFNETIGFNHGGYIHGNWRRETRNAGSHVLEKCCHDLDIANWLVDSHPVRAASFGGRDFFVPENEGRIDALGTDDLGRPAYLQWEDPHRVSPFAPGADIVDNQVAILEYANGVRATFHTNCNAAIPERRLYVCGTEGTLRAESGSLLIEVRRIGFDTETETFVGEAADAHAGGDAKLGGGLCRTMLHGESPLASVDEGIQSAVAAFGIDAAQQSGTVFHLAPLWKAAEGDEIGESR